MRLGASNWSLLAACLLSGQVWGQVATNQQDALQWLQRVAAAAHKLSYSGTFVYRNGLQSETSRIVHSAINGKQMEKLEVLDGSPREMIRQDDEVKCYLPERHLVIVEQRSTRRTFPALLPIGLAGLSEHYTIRKAGMERVAGIDSQIVRLEPRDAMRYGRAYWVDPESGLLLKADTFDAGGESLESLAFTELHIGAPANNEAFKSGSAGKPDWEVRQARLRDIHDDAQWLFRADLSGFRRQAAMQRNFPGTAGGDARSVLHWVYSDGLAALSVFISPLQGKAEPVDEAVQKMGALSVMHRVIDGYRVVVMGDVPPATIKVFADGIGVRGR